MTDETRADARIEDRHNTLFIATMRRDGRPEQVKVRDHSANGCRIQADGVEVRMGEEVSIERSGLTVAGRIAWHRFGMIGIRFDVPCPPGMFAPRRIETVRPHITSADIATGRRPGLTSHLSRDDRDRGRRWMTGAPRTSDVER